MTDLIYYMFYCFADKNAKHDMATLLIEIIATQFLSFFSFLIVGAFNIMVTHYLLWVLIISANGFIAYFLVKRYYIKSGRNITIFEKYSNTSSKRKAFYKVMVVLIFVFSMILLFAGGMMMSYLLSLHEQ